MKKILSFILGSIVALNLSMSVANSAAKEVRVAFFLEWPTPNPEDLVTDLYSQALGVPVIMPKF
jgi:taurine transport system substrate-binding protein